MTNLGHFVFFFFNKPKQTFTQYVNVSFPVLTNAPWFRDVNHGGSWVRGIENTVLSLQLPLTMNALYGEVFFLIEGTGLPLLGLTARNGNRWDL